MKLLSITRNRSVEKIKEKNSLILKEDNWDDFGFKTLFHLFYINEKLIRKEIGKVKIMEKGQVEGKIINLPLNPFKRLDEKYCSVGQEQSYYEELMAIPSFKRQEILRLLRDCVNDSAIFHEFKNEKCMEVSLLRTITLLNVEKTFPGILSGNPVPLPYSFKYRLNTSENCEIDIRVVPYSDPPTNIHVLIGRNGVGKTRILSGIADELTKNKAESSFAIFQGKIYFREIENVEGITVKEKFANLVTVNFSAFDNFSPIDEGFMKGDIRYKYVGLKKVWPNEENLLSDKTQDDLAMEFSLSLSICLDGQRKSRWERAIKILEADPIFESYKINDLVNGKNPKIELVNIFKTLSSGHKIVLLSVTKLIELVEEKTLVLIDEPETHLHPPLLASFTRVISDLLIKRNGVALISTHSPVVLQEVPKSCVTIIDRVGSDLKTRHPEIETFAENVGTLTREVFKLEVAESGFHQLIKEALKSETYENLIKKYENQIGSEGRAIARSIIISKNENA